MDNYLLATQAYIDYCKANGYSNTKIFFTTGPVDNIEGYAPDEAMYQAHIKYEYIRNYVKADPSRILFDYADILCYDNDGIQTTKTWNGHIFQSITLTNLSPIVPSYHISQVGALRLAKAMWWMLARIAGWNGVTTSINEDEEGSSSSSFVQVTNKQIRITVDDAYSLSEVNLYKLNGELVASRKIESNPCIINIAHLQAGVYIVVLSNQNGTKSQKIVVS